MNIQGKLTMTRPAQNMNTTIRTVSTQFSRVSSSP